MLYEEAKAKQDKIMADGYDIGHWYGVNCIKCCGLYPKIVTGIGNDNRCRYECEVCARRTKEYHMPWLAEEAWNRGDVEDETQLSFF